MATAVTAHAAENRRATMRSTRRPPPKCERTLASVKHQVTVRPRSATEGHVGVDVRRQGGRGEGGGRRRHHHCGGEHDPGPLRGAPTVHGARPSGVGHRCGLTAGLHSEAWTGPAWTSGWGVTAVGRARRAASSVATSAVPMKSAIASQAAPK